MDTSDLILKEVEDQVGGWVLSINLLVKVLVLKINCTPSMKDHDIEV